MRKSILIIEAFLIQFLLMTVWSVAYGQSADNIKTSFMFGRWVTDLAFLEKADGTTPAVGNEVRRILRHGGYATHADGSAAGDTMIWHADLQGTAPELSATTLNGTEVVKFINVNADVLSWDMDGDGLTNEPDSLWNFIEKTNRKYFLNMLVKFNDVSTFRAIWVSRAGNPGITSTLGIRIVCQPSSKFIEVRNANGTSHIGRTNSTAAHYDTNIWKSISIWNDTNSLYLSVNDTVYSSAWTGSNYADNTLTVPVIPNDGAGAVYLDYEFKEMTIWKDYVLTECERKLLQFYQNRDYALSIPGSALADVDPCLIMSSNQEKNVRRRGLRR